MIQYLRISARSMLCEGLSRLPPSPIQKTEESNNNNSSRESSSERTNSSSVTQSTFNSRTESSSRTLSSSSDQRRTDHDNHTSSKDDHKRERSDRNRHTSDKSRRSSYDDRRQRESSSSHRDRGRDDRRSRDDDKRKASLGSSKDEKSDDRERSDKDHHYRDDRRDRNRDRNDRDRRRDRERDRRHSRDDRSKDRHRDERSSYHKEKDRTRSRSRSRDRPPPPFRTMSYREEKGRNKLAQLEKLGIELKPPEGGDIATPGAQSEQSYYNPLATATQGKYAEQIQKRKLLWANKSKQDNSNSTSAAASTANTWMGTTFTHDQDGKVTAKFKRLMGIKDDMTPSAPTVGAKPDILKKQEEMFNNMEQQYEVARATTHTQRGVGLGYATGGYQFPR
ncbi:arginine/serine-rich coiled-coil protein 2 isoform X2 [Ooceraea biroi]|uniref:arginine/serine-rich coiled-coil protein 2 isoform X2 n=2 Tax=Ooceraea biroi TaxID=2015173 RepID=UPI0005B76D51|nr:arginine/serine-rich coiled-coil protein 2 isoform X2 [Ooceraea biroi]